MNAAQNSQRWAVDQRSKARAAMADALARERSEKITGLRASLAALEASNDPLAQQLAQSTRDQIARLT